MAIKKRKNLQVLRKTVQAAQDRKPHTQAITDNEESR